MKKILLMVAVAMMTAMSAQAQKIQIVDNDGNAIPLVSVMTENGNYIGTTDFDGVLNDVKGAAKVALTHVAYKPQLVTVASLQNGRVTMEDLDYGLDEVVVKPKPYLYVEYYYRVFSYIGDSLRVYTAGILPGLYRDGSPTIRSTRRASNRRVRTALSSRTLRRPWATSSIPTGCLTPPSTLTA